MIAPSMQHARRFHRADTSSIIAGAVALGLLAAFFGAAVPILGIFAPLIAIMAAFSLWVMLDFRAGVAFAIVLMPLSALTFFPHEMFGIRGLNPLNVILFLTILSYIVHASLRRWRDPIAPMRLLTWYVLPIAIAALVGMSSVGLIPPRFEALKLIQFNDSLSYLRDAFLKPQFLVLLALLVALAVRHSRQPERFLYLMLASGWVFCGLVAWLLAISGVPLRELASPLARTFLGRLGMHANEMSLLLNMLYALTLFSIREQEAGLIKKILFVSSVVFGMAVLMTFSRGGFLGFFLVNLVYFWKRLSVKTVIVGLIVSACVAPFVFDALFERAMTGVAGADRAALTAGRLDGIWLPLLPHVLAEPILPHGIYSMLWSAPVRLNKMLPVAQPHSAWLGTLMDLGLIGFGFVLAFLLYVRREFIRLAREHPAPTLQGMFAGAALLVPLWFLQGLTDDRFTPTFAQSYFWIALGVLIGCGGLYRGKNRAAAPAEHARGSKTKPPEAVGGLAGRPAGRCTVSARPNLPGIPCKVCLLNYYAWGVFADLDGAAVHIGGEEVQHVLLSRYLARCGYDVTSLVGDFGQRPVEQVDGVRVRKTFHLRDGWPGLRFFTPRVAATWAALRQADADVYYASCAGAMVGVVAEFCRRHRRRFVFRVASDADCAPHTLMLGNARDRMLYHYGLRRANSILVQTRRQADLLRQHYGLTASVADMFSDLPDSVRDFAPRGIDLLWLANMRSMKRPESFLAMVRGAPGLRCAMAGGAHPDEMDLFNRVSSGAAALPNLRFHGQVKFGTTRALFADSRIFINTSSFEGFPNTYLQAWANGVPVIATFDPDGIIANHGLGLAVSDAAAAAAGAQALLADPAAWAACSARCRAWALARLAPEQVSAPYLAAMVPA